jgi:TetR/AcrR family transcriptional regulator
MWKIVQGQDLLSKEALTRRRKALLEFLGQAIFRDRQHGAELAAQVFADTPMPDVVPELPAMGNEFGREE